MTLNKIDAAGQSKESQLATIQQAQETAFRFPAARYEFTTDLQPITFAFENRRKGYAVVFTIGTTIGTGIDHVLVVPKRTRDILDAMKIPYTTISRSDLRQMRK